MTQTDFATTIKDPMADLKEYIKEIIADQDAKFDKKARETATALVTPYQREFIKNGRTRQMNLFIHIKILWTL